MSHSALGHGGGLGHVVLYHLGNTCRWGRRRPGEGTGQRASERGVEGGGSLGPHGMGRGSWDPSEKGRKREIPARVHRIWSQSVCAKGRRKDRVARRVGRGCIPCREDLASAAISWIVRALRDLGSIATVSPTFTLGDSTRGSVPL